MNTYDKIRKFINKKHSINCALTYEIIEFIDKLEQEDSSKKNVKELIKLLEKHMNSLDSMNEFLCGMCCIKKTKSMRLMKELLPKIKGKY